ncbi:HNH endonuclease [Cytobacillus firmus]|uniref:HNH endonuclease n=1 Tax=Cytobacillus firmus TaxID=1399 RepID=UPI00237BCC85|nr:HNH endonuclease [Cytobacillus firmus]MDD9312672.1 HNH endonuclease [Cytobacillus firmus]
MNEQIFSEPYKSNRAKPIKYMINENGCWNCVSHALDNQKKYPVVTRNGRYWRMSRYVFTISKGVIPEGMFILHSCDNPQCINPNHLSMGTPKENSLDMVSKGRQAKGVKNGGGVKLDEDKVRAIREDNRSLQSIADDYGISKKLVINVKKMRNWRHVI